MQLQTVKRETRMPDGSFNKFEACVGTDDWYAALRNWCSDARQHLRKGTYKPHGHSKKLRRLERLILRSGKQAGAKLGALRLCQRTLLAVAASLAARPDGARKWDTRIVVFHAHSFVPAQYRAQGLYLGLVVQWLYTRVAGRLSTPFGGLRFFFVAALASTLYFADLYWLFGGIEWTAGTRSEIRGVDYIYFSAVTLATLGYGDIHPATGPIALLAVFEAFLRLSPARARCRGCVEIR